VSSAYPLSIVFASRLLRHYGAFLDLTEVFSVKSRPSTISGLDALFVKNPSKDRTLSFTHAANLVTAVTPLQNKRNKSQLHSLCKSLIGAKVVRAQEKPCIDLTVQFLKVQSSHCFNVSALCSMCLNILDSSDQRMPALDLQGG
jgi:hypothetical protein